jgi:hypothetical protein
VLLTAGFGCQILDRVVGPMDRGKIVQGAAR